MIEPLSSLGWKGLKIAENPKWAAVKDLRLPEHESLGNMLSIHAKVREEIEWRGEQTDEWAAPQVTIARGYGDCEDICILERALLIAAGYNPEDIELMIVWDQLAHQHHAILWVKEHFLDHRSDKVLHVSEFNGFLPSQAHRACGSFVYGKVTDGPE